MFLKRLFDIVASFCGIVILFPLIVIVSILIKLTSKDSLFYGLGNTFRNCVEYVAIFQKSGCPVLRLSERNVIFEEVGKRTIKPKNWERNLVTILSNKHLNGVYIFFRWKFRFHRLC